MSTEKTINYIIVSVLVLIFIALGIFILANWSYLSNPHQISNYPKFSIFEGREDLAKYKDWCFFYPWKTICYLSFFQIIVLIFLRTYKKMEMSKIGLITILIILISLYFSNDIFQFLSISEFTQIDSSILFSPSFCFSVYLFLFSLVLFFFDSYKKYRFFLILNLITALTSILFVFGYIMLFFD